MDEMAYEDTKGKQKTRTKNIKNVSNLNVTLHHNLQNLSSLDNKFTNHPKHKSKNLDVTFSRKKNPVHSNTAVDTNFYVDSLYGDYLQNLFKQHIIIRQIRASESVLLGQISQQLETVYMMMTTYTKMSDEVEKASSIDTFKELMCISQNKSKKYGLLEKNFALKRELSNLIDKLSKTCIKTVFENCELTNPQELDEVLKILQLNIKQIETALSDSHSLLLNSLADNIRKLSKLEDSISNLYILLSNLSEDTSYKVLENVSEYFVREKFN